MEKITIRLPSELHAKFRKLAKHRKISVNKLMEERSTIALAEFDAETRFRVMVAKGSRQQGLEILDKLDNH